jgi:hypothetical protein
LAQPTSKSPNSRKRAVSRKGGVQPITHHLLFPAIVALWFAALLGLGSFVLSTALIERLVLATHLDTVVTAAAPPLGVTARLLLASALGLIGGAIGFGLARRIGRATKAPAPHVFNVAEAGIDALTGWPGMASAEQPEPVPALHSPTSAVAPMPFEDGPRLAAAPLPIDPPAMAPLEVEPLAVDRARDLAPGEAIIEHAAPAASTAAAAQTPQPSLLAAPTVSGPTAADRIAGADLASLSHVELIERLAIALQRREDQRDTLSGVAQPGPSVVSFPDFADRRNARPSLPPRPLVAAAPTSGRQTEMALRDALVALQRMSGGA